MLCLARAAWAAESHIRRLLAEDGTWRYTKELRADLRRYVAGK